MRQNVLKQMDKKEIVILVSAVVAALVVIYLGFSIYFTNHFYFGTKIGNVKVSGQSASVAEKTLQQSLKDYELAIVQRDGTTDSIIGADIDLTLEWNTKPAKSMQ